MLFMTKSKKLYLECYKFKTKEVIEKEAWRFKSLQGICPICKESNLNANYEFAIYTYLDYKNNKDMQLLPFCTECMFSDYLYSMSYDKIIYFKSKDDKLIYMIDIAVFISLCTAIYSLEVSAWKLITFFDEKNIKKYIKSFIWVERQLVPCFYTPPDTYTKDLPKNNKELDKFDKNINKLLQTTVKTLPLPTHIKKEEIVVKKQFKIYSELKIKGV